jgi:hypothetical protein
MVHSFTEVTAVTAVTECVDNDNATLKPEQVCCVLRVTMHWCVLQGDYVEILIMTKDGIRREELTLKLD